MAKGRRVASARKVSKTGRPKSATMAAARIERPIFLIRGHKVMLSPDLAALYQVEPRALVQAVKRNTERFPEDFMFRLSKREAEDLKSQSVISSSGWGGSRLAPFAFTEQGVAMLSTVLRSPRAVEVSTEIVRAFVRLRQLLATHDGLRGKLEDLEKKYDRQFSVVFDAIRQLMEPPDEGDEDNPHIGYHTERDG